MSNNKDLSKEFNEVMEEAKAMVLSAATSSMASDTDGDDLVTSIKMLRLLTRTCDLCCAMFEKQNELMDKLNKAADKYLYQ